MSNKRAKSIIKSDNFESFEKQITKKLEIFMKNMNERQDKLEKIVIELKNKYDKLEKIVIELINKKDVDNNTLNKENQGSCQETINPYFSNQIEIEEKYKGKDINDFINSVELEDLGYEFYLAKEIENDNETINSLISEKAYEEYLPENEKIKNETVGNFFYSIGGISRVSYLISNHLFYNLHKKFFCQNNRKLILDNVNDRKYLSIWIKKCINENPFYECFSINNIKTIEKYFYKDDKKANEFLFKIFQLFLSLYLKCRLSFPIVEVQYLNDNCEYNPHTMLDIIDKRGKAKKVNYCYIPELKSNGKTLGNGKPYVFTYFKNQTFQKQGKIYDNKQIEIETFNILSDSKK